MTFTQEEIFVIFDYFNIVYDNTVRYIIDKRNDVSCFYFESKDNSSTRSNYITDKNSDDNYVQYFDNNFINAIVIKHRRKNSIKYILK